MNARQFLGLMGALGGPLPSVGTWSPTEQRTRLVFDDLAKALLAVSEHSRPVLYVDNTGVKYKIYPGGKIRRCKYNTKPPAGYYAPEVRG